MTTPHQGRARRLLAVGLMTILLGLLGGVAPSSTAPAGAWGGPVSPGCNASGASGKSGSTWRAYTTGSTCGSNWVRFRSWGFYGSWDSAVAPAQALVSDSSNPTLWGGADHRSCNGCTIVWT